MCKLLGCVDVCGLIHRMRRVIAEAGEIVESCSIIVNRKGECSKPIFQILVYYYKLFYASI